MATRVYGASDDLVEFEGDFHGETGAGRADKTPILLIFNDGTVLSVKYGKPGGGIWQIDLVERGLLFERIDICTDAEASIYSDIAYFHQGVKRVIAAKEWSFVD